MILASKLSVILTALALSAHALPQGTTPTATATSEATDSVSVDPTDSATDVSSATATLSSTLSSALGSASVTASVITSDIVSTPTSGAGVASGTSTSAAGAQTTGTSGNGTTGDSSNITYIESSGPAVQGDNVTFTDNVAYLFLDYVEGILASARNTSEGEYFLNQSQQLSEAVHQASPAPLVVYSRLFFNESGDVSEDATYGFNLTISESATNFTDGSNATDIAAEVTPAANDTIVQKTRYSAAFNNTLLDTLASNNITSVILSGIRVSGVVLSTAYDLFDNNYNVFIVSNTSFEPDPDSAAIKEAILGPQGVVSRLPANVISIEQALQALDTTASTDLNSTVSTSTAAIASSTI